MVNRLLIWQAIVDHSQSPAPVHPRSCTKYDGTSSRKTGLEGGATQKEFPGTGLLVVFRQRD